MSFRYNFTVKSILITYGKLRTKTVLFHSWRLRNASVVVQVLLMRFRGRFLSDKIWFGANVKCFLTLLCQGFFSFSPPINFLIWECIRSTWKKLRSFHWCRVIYLTRIKSGQLLKLSLGAEADLSFLVARNLRTELWGCTLSRCRKSRQNHCLYEGRSGQNRTDSRSLQPKAAGSIGQDQKLVWAKLV